MVGKATCENCKIKFKRMRKRRNASRGKLFCSRECRLEYGEKFHYASAQSFPYMLKKKKG